VPLDHYDISRLYRRHARAMTAFFARRTYDPEAAVDLLAETFAVAFEDRDSFRGEGDEAAIAWIYGIARHQLSGFYRRGSVERRAMAKLGVERRELTDPEYERIEELAGVAQTRRQVATALGQLPSEHAFALRLRVVDELGYNEVAAALGISEQAARARVSRGLRALAQDLDLVGDEVHDRA
jgi:RNA polymerase sigma-70 factor (ECF subfamily)